MQQEMKIKGRNFNTQVPNMRNFASFIPKNIPKGFFLHKNSRK